MISFLLTLSAAWLLIELGLKVFTLEQGHLREEGILKEFAYTDLEWGGDDARKLPKLKSLRRCYSPTEQVGQPNFRSLAKLSAQPACCVAARSSAVASSSDLFAEPSSSRAAVLSTNKLSTPLHLLLQCYVFAAVGMLPNCP
ncbi:hypothetical protein AAHA92_33202 [Salvia divinorum]|uniref:Uncharacterized protein n=1 Tax=Salvia divinorum TaxID=28513 RepID=A0ABD1FN88_SALDI